jgi:hypothetical protein
VAAIESWPGTGRDGDLRIGGSLLRGRAEHDRDTGTCRIQVRLARGPLRPPLPMRLHIDRWSAWSTAVELIPARRVRPTAAYFRAGHRLLGSLTRRWSMAEVIGPGVPAGRQVGGERGMDEPGDGRGMCAAGVPLQGEWNELRWLDGPDLRRF